MNKLKFTIVDVFAEEKYSGNQLAVFHAARSLSEIDMQRIAREINYSETTFILSGKRENNGYDVRIFTPRQEVPFAGHPVLGTAYVIQREIVQKSVKKIKLNLASGQFQVTFKYKGNDADRLWMKQAEPVFGRSFDARGISDLLGLPVTAVDLRFPVQEVSTGLSFIIVPLKTLNDVRGARIKQDQYAELMKESTARALFLFSPETYNEGNDLNARMFAPYYGIPEDPATGSANGCLAGYLVHHGYFDSDKINIRVEQGHEIHRPSVLYLRAEKKEEGTDVYVGGKVIMIASGEFL